jgi:hypothetical protein
MLHPYYAITSMNDECEVIFKGEYVSPPSNKSHYRKLLLSLRLHINLSPVQHLSDLTLMPSSVCYPTTNATSCPQNKMQAEVADWGISLVEHASYIAVYQYLPYT